MKKFFSLVLALVMALSLTTVAWAAPAEEVDNYADFAAAIAAGKDVILMDDIEGDGIVIDASITIDLNDHTYTINGDTVGSKHTETLGVQILDGNTVTIKNGTIVGSDDADKPGCPDGDLCTNSTASGHHVDPKVDYGVKVVIMNYAGLTLDNVTVKAGEETIYAMSINSGDVTLKDSDIETESSDTIAFDTCKSGSYATPTVTVEGDSDIEGDVVVDGGALVVEGGYFYDEITVTDDSYAEDITIEGGTFSGDVSDYLPEGLTQSGSGSVVSVPNKPVSTKNSTILVPTIDDLDEPLYTYWDADVESKKAEKEKDCEFATYTISMVAKADDAPIWWLGSGVEEEGEDVDFEWDGDDTFVKVVSADYAAFAVVKGKTITYFAPASWYNTDGWDEKAKEVTLPVLPDAEKDMKCCTNYAWDETRTTFYKVEDTLYRPATAADDPDDMLVFNVGGAAVIVVEAEVLNATRVDRDSKMAYDNLYDYEDDFDYVYSAHNYAVTIKGDTYGNGEVTKVSCDICKKSFKFVESDDVADAVKAFEAGNYFDMGDFEQGFDGLYLSISETSKAGKDSGSSGSGNYKPSTDNDDKDDEADTTTKPSTDKVTSAATFDAGIAMYVGMSVMAAAGSAVVLKKKD